MLRAEQVRILTCGAPGGRTTSSISGLCAGIYTVTVTDATGCSQVVPVPVSNVNSTIVLNTNSTDITCNGSCNGTGTVNVTSGSAPFTYNWSTGSTTTTTSGLCQEHTSYKLQMREVA
jgi:hypothetical protein